MTPGNSYTNKIFTENVLTYNDWGREILSPCIGGLAKGFILLPLLYLFISSLIPSNILKRFALKQNMRVVNWAWSSLQLKFCKYHN